MTNPIKHQRFEILDGLGEDEVFWMYVEKCNTVRELASTLFEPHGDAEQPSCKELYQWLHAEEGRWERWQEAKRFKATFMAEGALETALAATESNVRSSRLKAEYLKWMSGVLDPAQSERTTVEVGVSIAAEWLEAMTEPYDPDEPRRQLTEEEEAEIDALFWPRQKPPTLTPEPRALLAGEDDSA